MPKKAEIIGMKFGNFVITDRIKEKGRNARFVCQCDCGEVFTEVANRIINHKVTSCEKCRIRVCPVCEKKLPAKGNSIYCSKECRRIRRNYGTIDNPPAKLKEQETCQSCGHDFKPIRPRQVTCSRECARERQLKIKRDAIVKKEYNAKPCLVCNENFIPKRISQIICQKESCKTSRKLEVINLRARTGELSSIFKNKKICTICGEEFMGHKNATACTKRECILARARINNRFVKKRNKISCIVCKKEFWPTESGRKYNHYTCSNQCQKIALKEKELRFTNKKAHTTILTTSKEMYERLNKN
jgi:hypothetical protein